MVTSVRSLALTAAAVAISNSHTSVDALKLTLKPNTDGAGAAKPKPTRTSTKSKWPILMQWQRKPVLPGGEAQPVAPLEAQPVNSNTDKEIATTTPKTDLIASEKEIDERLADLKKKIEFHNLWGGDRDEAVWKSDWELIKNLEFDLDYLVNDVVERTKIINEAENSTNKRLLLIAANDFIMSTFRRNTDRSLCSSLWVNWYIVLQNFSRYLEIRLLNSNFSSFSNVPSILKEWGYQRAEDVFKSWYEQDLGDRNPFSSMESNSPLATQKLERK